MAARARPKPTPVPEAVAARARAAVVPVPAGQAAEGAARSGARQARNFNRPDYNFRLDRQRRRRARRQRAGADHGAPARRAAGPDRVRGDDPGQQHLGRLARPSSACPAIYRSQASLAPGIKVRMGTKALPHAGIGVKSYAWSTSPLRRYTDLVNQWQIIAAARHGRTAALAAPFKPKDAELFSDHLGLRRGVQRPTTPTRPAWNASGRSSTCSSRASSELVGTVFREGLVRADDLPLVLPVTGRRGPAARRAGAGEAGRDRRDHAGRARHGDRTSRCGARADRQPTKTRATKTNRSPARSPSRSMSTDSEAAPANAPLTADGNPLREPALVQYPADRAWRSRLPSMRSC